MSSLDVQQDRPGMHIGLSLFFILGVITFILPTLLNIFSIGVPSWTFKAGIVLIVLGVIDMIFLRWAVM